MNKNITQRIIRVILTPTRNSPWPSCSCGSRKRVDMGIQGHCWRSNVTMTVGYQLFVLKKELIEERERKKRECREVGQGGTSMGDIHPDPGPLCCKRPDHRFSSSRDCSHSIRLLPPCSSISSEPCFRPRRWRTQQGQLTRTVGARLQAQSGAIPWPRAASPASCGIRALFGFPVAIIATHPVRGLLSTPPSQPPLSLSSSGTKALEDPDAPGREARWVCKIQMSCFNGSC